MSAILNKINCDPPRQEKIGGKIYLMSPMPNRKHGTVSRNIFRIFDRHLYGKKCEVFIGDFDVHLSDDDYFVPDVAVVCNQDIIKDDGIYGAPDLVVEALSASTARHDRKRKFQMYEQSGVKEYWIVSPSDKILEVYHNTGSGFILSHTYAQPDDYVLERMDEKEKERLLTHFKTTIFDDLTISVAEIFQDI